MTQSVAAGKINKAIGGSKNFQYKPISSEDLTTAVETAFSRIADAKGQRWTVNGSQSVTLNDILHMIEKQVGREGTRLSGNLGLSDFIEEFFTGITHDKNMARMAEFFDTHSVNLEGDAPDYHKKFGINQSVNLDSYFGGKKVKEEDLIFPIFSNYKMVSLD